MLQVIFISIFISSIEVLNIKVIVLKILLWVDFKPFFRSYTFPFLFSGLDNLHGYSVQVLGIPKFVRVLFVVSVAVVTPMIFTALKYVLRQLKL